MAVIGITTSLNTPHGAAPSQSVPVAYANAVADAGGTPLLLPMLQRGDGEVYERLIGICDALVIVGGGVIAKGMVGAQPDDLSDTPTMRDSSDTTYLRLAMNARKPVLGICYGMQFINAHLHGGITADWQAHMGGGTQHAHSPSRNCNEHSLGTLLEGSKIERILHEAAPEATAEQLRVNSYHLQGIGPEMLADGLILTATAADGCVEAFESPDGLLHGIQWHPEKMYAEGETSSLAMLGVFEELVRQASGNGGGKL